MTAPLKLQFDAYQPFQLDAVRAVVDLFAGQPEGPPALSVLRVDATDTLYAGKERNELGIGNRLLLAEEQLRANARDVQLRNDIDVAEPERPLDAWELFDGPANTARRCPHFSVEMETGTGKTYVYLRTIRELSRKYGFQKFVIVVPSVAIRQGVLASLQSTADHFDALFDRVPVESFVYDSARLERVRQFAIASTLQVMVINIQAFLSKKNNVIYDDRDGLSGRKAIEYVQAARPIVVIDEPQSVDATEKSQEALQQLNPLCTLRYSATHKNPWNLVYRLDPVRAFELELVKRIVVASATVDGGANDAFVRVEKIEIKNGIRAKVRLHVQTKEGPVEKSVTVKSGADLHALSNERACYANGFKVAEIRAEPGDEFVRFANGQLIRLGAEIGGRRDDVWRAQIRHTIEKHLEKELQLAGRGIKVLSLFFIDRVANYRGWDDTGALVAGKFAVAFEEALAALAKEERFKPLAWLKEPIERLHGGYFAQDRQKKHWKESREGRSTQDDDDAYELIMNDKERLLTLDEPLRFLFSHSALREGWDNPNVFQICTLNETKSAMKKRQEIGRGLRLPVDQSGKRVRDPSVNRLTVMANESYEEFARALQGEYEEECGVTFGKLPSHAFEKLVRVNDGGEVPIGKTAAAEIKAALVAKGFIDVEGRLQPAFDPRGGGFSEALPEAHRDLAAPVLDLLTSYQFERHITRERDERKNRLKKEIAQSPEFEALWQRIRPRTTYRVEFATDELVRRAARAISRMDRIEAPKVTLRAGRLELTRGAVTTLASSVAEELIDTRTTQLPDVLGYLVNMVPELTRRTLQRILVESGRLAELLVDPQRFLDAVAHVLRHVLRDLLVDGIKYERLPGDGPETRWEMALFENEEIVDQLRALAVKKSLYDWVVHDSAVEREFARRLDERDDIELFVKLPRSFKIDTPLGSYSPDWAIVKKKDQRLYLVKETKSTHDPHLRRTEENLKISCGRRHFEALGVDFGVATSADQV